MLDFVGATTATQVSVNPWEKIVDDGGVYYFNTVTQESQWEKPEGFVDPDEDKKAATTTDGGDVRALRVVG